MKTTHTGDQGTRRTRFAYAPDRHYVLAERESKDWDGSGLDNLLDQVTPDGEDAYRIEADGSKGSSERQASRSSRMVLLSCSKEYNDKQQADISRQSKAVARAVAAETDTESETLQELSAISFADLPTAEELAKQRASV